MGAFTGQLNTNEIYSALYNMIISQEVFDRIGDSSELVDKAKVDGSLYGDTKLYYAADVLASSAWGNDAEAANLLSLDRPAAPECQKITLDKFRQIRLTLDDYLSKRAWSDASAFGQFNSLMEGMVGKTKRIYDVTLYNAFIGTDEVAAQDVEVEILSTDAPETEAKKIAQKVADLLVELKTVNRKYNEYGHVTKFSEDEVKVIWNSKFVNKIKKIDLPAIFHKDGLMDKFEENVLPDIYFGDICSVADVGSGLVLEGNKVHSGAGLPTIRAKVEKTVGTGANAVHYFPGEIVADNTTVGGSSASFLYEEVYKQTEDVIAKVYVKLPAYMSAFEVGTSFFNPRSLTTNRYLTFGHNTIEHFKAYPCITMVESVVNPEE